LLPEALQGNTIFQRHVYGYQIVSKIENKTLVSLGMSCQTTHQLRRLLNVKEETDPSPKLSTESHSSEPGPFDWLICPPASTTALLNNGIPDFTKNSIHLHNNRPYWADLDIYFWHNFLVTDQGKRSVDIHATFEQELKRWQHLRDRFAALNPSQTIFVISNTQNNLATEVFDDSEHDKYHFTNTGLDALTQSLAQFFSTQECKIHLQIVTRKERSEELSNEKKVSYLPLDQNEWKGSKNSWNNWWQQLELQ